MTDILSKIGVQADGCWNWIAGGFINREGYRIISVNAHEWRAHRYVYEQTLGAIPDGLVIDHLCRNRSCVNPDHLEPVTIAENVMRGVLHRRAIRLASIDPAEVQLRTNQPRRGVAGTRNAEKTHCPQGHPYSPENTIKPKGSGRRCLTCRRRQVRDAIRRRSARLLLAADEAR